MLFFSDAVVAIAISLLILPLVDIVTEGELDVSDLWNDHGGQFFAFALSFAVIAQYWIIHHRVFEQVLGYTSGIMWANMLWLATIVFLPLPTEMLGLEATGNRAVHGFYIGSVLASSASLTVITALILHNPQLQRDPVGDPVSLVPGLISTGLIAAALVIAVAVPVINMWAMMLVFLTGPLRRRYDPRQRSGPTHLEPIE